jgi:hypothetical protein
MAKPLEAGMPRDLDLVGTYTIRFAALDPTSGAAVAGVKVSNMVLTVAPQAGTDPIDLAYGPYLLVPGPGA